MDELLRDFLQETGEHVDAAGEQLVRLERDPSDAAMIAAIFRLLHTIKGTCGFLGLARLGRLAHAAEALLDRLRAGAPATSETVALILAAVDRIRFLLAEIERRQAEPDGSDDDLIAALSHETAVEGAAASPLFAGIPQTESTADSSREEPRSDRHASIRVAVGSLETLAALVSELVLTRNQLSDIVRRSGVADLTPALSRLSSIVTDLQDSVMHARMQPLERLFASLPRLVRDLGRDLGKEMALVVEGADTELDRQLIEAIRDPLTHLVRNCADHGLESTAERLAAGKPAQGAIRVAASHAAGQVFIEVSDDGRGLDLPRIGATALRRGLITEAALVDMTTDDVARLIFTPGFSTTSSVTAISGRGVGLDVVRANIEAIGGEVTVAASRGAGTRFTIRIPLTLAIAPALIVSAGGQRFALPQGDVAEIVATADDSPHRLESVQGCDVLHVRDETIPLLDLSAILRLPASQRAGEERAVAIIRCGRAAFGLRVDAIDDLQEIVVKPTGGLLASLKIYAGHTILGDGSIVLILDPLGIAERIGLRKTRSLVAPPLLPERKTAKTRILTFRAGSQGVKALPLAFINRIEMVRPADIERSAGRLVVRRDDGLLALLPLIEGSPLREPEQPVLIVEISGHTFGLLVDEIVDIVDAASDVAIPGATPDALGAADIDGTITEFVDAAHVMQGALRAGRMAQLEMTP